MTPAPLRPTTSPRSFESAVREQLRAHPDHHYALPHVTPLERHLEQVGPERAV